ncbi:MAG TPA: amidohydrolase family protein [Streptosporangiaceae bacterium]|nr:amidohydrolase family protein [Streptosporangiaceae bacterium]
MTGEHDAEIAEVNAFWRELGLPGLVDVHVHFMPQNVQAKVWAHFENLGEGVYWPVIYRMAEEDRVALLRQFGLRRFGALVYPHKPDMAQWLNSWSVEFAARTPDALQSATFFPEPSAGRYVAEAIEAGARLFKAHVQVGGYDPRDEVLDPVWGLLAEAGIPVVVHCGTRPTPGEFLGPGPISEVLARHPRLTLIVAHMGALEYGEFLDLTERYPRVYLDTTMVFTEFLREIAGFPPELLPRLVDRGDRILLGTDFPSIPYRYVTQLDALAKLDLGDDWLRAVCWENPVRLLGL